MSDGGMTCKFGPGCDWCAHGVAHSPVVGEMRRLLGELIAKLDPGDDAGWCVFCGDDAAGNKHRSGCDWHKASEMVGSSECPGCGEAVASPGGPCLDCQHEAVDVGETG